MGSQSLRIVDLYLLRKANPSPDFSGYIMQACAWGKLGIVDPTSTFARLLMIALCACCKIVWIELLTQAFLCSFLLEQESSSSHGGRQ